MKILEVKNLSFSYEDAEVLRNINFTVNDNDFIILSGKNGSGKSTLLKILIGELKNYKGSVEFFGEDLSSFNNWRKVGYVPQISRDNSTNFPISVKEMILLNLYFDFNKFNLPKPRHHRMVKDAILSFNLTEFQDKNFNELSGGQKQRVMIAKAMVHNPDILIFDEPTVGVDKESKESFFELINHLHKHHDITIILVTHEDDLAKDINNRTFILEEKELRENV